MGSRPLVVIEGARNAVRARRDAALEEAIEDGWRIVRGWVAPMHRDRVVCTGWIRSPDDAARALLAALAGAGLVVVATADGRSVDRFLEDLRRLDPVDHVRIGPAQPGDPTARQRALLGLVAEGLTLGEAAAEVGVARGRAGRLLAAARRTHLAGTRPIRR